MRGAGFGLVYRGTFQVDFHESEVRFGSSLGQEACCAGRHVRTKELEAFRQLGQSPGADD